MAAVSDTAIVDLTDELQDPVEVLFGVQLGGGTDINGALTYCQGLVRRPQETILVLISDLYEGGIRAEFLKRMHALQVSGVQVVVLLALSDEGRPAYDHEIAGALGVMGISAFACTPDLFPQLMAAANAWIRKNGPRTVFGNLMTQRYLQNTKYVTDATSAAGRKRFESQLALFQKYGDRYQLDYLLMAAQAYQESRLDQSVKSSAGAIGVMQVLPSTGKDMKVGDIKNLDSGELAGGFVTSPSPTRIDAKTTTTTQVHGVHFDTSAGAVLTIEASIGGLKDGSFLFFVQDGKVNGGFSGKLTNPLQLRGKTP
jgi:hypothetical protein